MDPGLVQIMVKLCNLSQVVFVGAKPAGAMSFMVNTTEYFIMTEGTLDIGTELKKLHEDLEYNRGFLSSVMKKLDNQRFVQNAPPDVIELERKKKNDAETRISALEKRIRELMEMKG
jgi:valyl-tRNA synthetase